MHTSSKGLPFPKPFFKPDDDESKYRNFISLRQNMEFYHLISIFFKTVWAED